MTSAAQRAVFHILAAYGEDFAMIRASRSRPSRGLFAPMDGSTTGIYFDSNEAVGLLRPAQVLYTDGAQAEPPLTGDVYFRDGRLWTVRKTQVFRLSGLPILVLSLCD